MEVTYKRPAIPIKFITTHCPRKCGWTRTYQQSNEWLTRIVDHPLYGPTTEMELVQLDVRSHECHEYHNALIRLKTRRYHEAA